MTDDNFTTAICNICGGKDLVVDGLCINCRALKAGPGVGLEVPKLPVNVQPLSYKSYGWVCPLCGSAVSPWTDRCPCSTTYKVSCSLPNT